MAYSDDGEELTVIFDEAKDRENRRKHGISLNRATDLFSGRHVEQLDDTTDYGEERWSATGMIDGAFFNCTHTDRGRYRRIISLRRATRREVEKYIQAE